MPSKVLRASYRSVMFFIHLLVALFVCLIMPILFGRAWFNKPKGKVVTQWWSSRTTKILGLTISHQGQPCQATSLIVANHISFLDIVVIASSSPAVFLSKSSLRYWPIIGFIATSIGTIFIQRQKKRELLAATQSLTSALSQQQSLVLFPEGTTTIGHSVNKFHSSLFQAAINAGAPVQPVALYYERNGGIDNIAAYIGNDNFIFTLFKIMAQTRTRVKITFCNLVYSENMTRSELAAVSHNIISQKINRVNNAAQAINLGST